MAKQKKIKSVVLRTESIFWKHLSFLQTDDLKDLSPEDRQRLKSSILKNNFADPFKVWDNTCHERRIYSLDGRHRFLMLKELEDEGYAVPDMLPATFIDCPNKEVAAALVLVYSSQYARPNQEGLFAYLQEHNLDLETMKEYLSLPGIELEKLQLPDFSELNKELSVGDFPDLMEMKFFFTREDFAWVNGQLDQIRVQRGLESKEDALKSLIRSEIHQSQ